MSWDPKDIAAIACGSFLVLCCSVVMIIHLCRPELLNRKLKEQMDMEEADEERMSPQGAEDQTPDEVALADL